MDLCELYGTSRREKGGRVEGQGGAIRESAKRVNE